jgi:hypothetical protein
MARRQLSELCPSTISNYRSLARKLWQRSIAGVASESDKLELAELEQLLGVKASKIRGPGRPPKYGNPDEQNLAAEKGL